MRVRLDARGSSGLTRVTDPILRCAQDDARCAQENAGRVPSALRLTVWSDSQPRPGWLNMAIDRALLERAAAGESWLRLYAWSPACLSFGRHEPAARRYDRARIEQLGLDVVRRPTGGRAVWHAGELTYAVAAPATALGTLREAYGEIHRVIRNALRTLGAPAELAPVRVAIRPEAGACFAAPAGGEVLVGDHKVVGGAQLRENGALLQHGSILLADDQAMVARITRGDAPADRSAPLARLLGRPVGWGEAAEAVTRAAAERWGAPGERVDDCASVVQQAHGHAARFRSAEWTWDGANTVVAADAPETPSSPAILVDGPSAA
jgi:lipoate-protein ligase A